MSELGKNVYMSPCGCTCDADGGKLTQQCRRSHGCKSGTAFDNTDLTAHTAEVRKAAMEEAEKEILTYCNCDDDDVYSCVMCALACRVCALAEEPT